MEKAYATYNVEEWYDFVCPKCRRNLYVIAHVKEKEFDILHHSNKLDSFECECGAVIDVSIKKNEL